MSVTPSPEAIEAATLAMSQCWRNMHTNEALGYQRMLATAALTAAAPLIEARAKAEALALILALHRPFTEHPSGIGTKYCVHCWDAAEGGSAECPCATARAATLQEEA